MDNHSDGLGQAYRQGDVVAAKRKLRQLIQAGEVPRFLRAVQKIKGSKKKVYHFVEWHSGDAKMMMSPTSFTQLCVYEDLGEVCYCCHWFCSRRSRCEERSPTSSRILANRNRCSMDFRQMANSVASRCGTGRRHPHCRFA